MFLCSDTRQKALSDSASQQKCGLANRIDGDNTVGGKCLLATTGNISFSIISERHQYFMVLEFLVGELVSRIHLKFAARFNEAVLGPYVKPCL